MQIYRMWINDDGGGDDDDDDGGSDDDDYHVRKTLVIITAVTLILSTPHKEIWYPLNENINHCQSVCHCPSGPTFYNYKDLLC